MKSSENNPRRQFIKKSAGAAASLSMLSGLFPQGFINLTGPDNEIAATGSGAAPTALKKVAFIANQYRNSAHADVIGTKLFVGIPTDDGMVAPQVQIVSVWIDQIGANDTGVRIAKMNNATLYPTIAQALTLGGDKLAVDAVIYIGEHGDYPYSRLGVKMYPRMNYLEQIFRVFDASNRSVPLFSDKHLAYSWLDSKWIYDRAQELKVPMMAGSSLPYCWRDPMLVHPLGTKITEAVAIGYASLDAYGFHVMEILQCMVERRAGGETGVASVQGLTGDAVWKAIDAGKISKELVEAACNSIKGRAEGNMRDIVKDPKAVIVRYNDGLKGAILMLDELVKTGWAYAAKAGGKTVATEFVLDNSMSYSHFSYLTLNIQKFLVTEKPQGPVERNLLTSGMIDMGIRSAVDGGKERKTPFLNIKYTAAGTEPILPVSPRPTGQSIGPWPPAGYEFIIPDSFKKK
ncbi:hypothetical protein DYBT9275_06057 [Dyadobacter sp. CECT 9275]|uniref:Uncharacterized protein n=1 Tax=Dyadobacter helix TaxID=2822344 RepID=A0A916JJY7_9BACT|nr:hypothetical protein [Dyadobacter sp. CECT 9275]CAG5018718.1 hypothetical protein DYBT9275_06057 [Dyadobacter sp. CECT 9275]